MSVVGVVGTGLIGGSLGAALRQRGWLVRGTDADPSAAAEARRLGLIDEAHANLASCVDGADVVVLAVPVGRIPKLLRSVDAHAPSGALLLDTGSVKQPIVAAMQVLSGAERAVGGHPLAGSHRAGPAAATPDLFHDQPFVLCPSNRTTGETLGRAASIAREIGAVPRILSALEHDRSVAVTSHLPQILSSLLGALPADRGLAGPGYRDMTRLAGSSAAMWSDILLSNRDEVLRAVRSYRTSLDVMTQALADGDRLAVERVIARGQAEVAV